jgi:hypothetical protein
MRAIIGLRLQEMRLPSKIMMKFGRQYGILEGAQALASKRT